MKEDNYIDIINLPHHISIKHPRMDISKRAAQFAPFQALTGYEENIKETARLTDKRIEIDEQLKIILNNKIQIIINNLDQKPEVTFTYFIYDIKKNGGKYINVTGIVKKIDTIEEYILLTNKTKIPIKEIININSKLFENYQIY